MFEAAGSHSVCSERNNKNFEEEGRSGKARQCAIGPPKTNRGITPPESFLWLGGVAAQLCNAKSIHQEDVMIRGASTALAVQLLHRQAPFLIFWFLLAGSCVSFKATTTSVDRCGVHGLLWPETAAGRFL